jgi:hypothetical protein
MRVLRSSEGVDIKRRGSADILSKAGDAESNTDDKN